MKPRRKSYPGRDDPALRGRFLPLSKYLALAKDAIKKFGRGDACQMLSSEDAIGYVAEQIMIADWGFNASIGNDIDGFRSIRSLWAVRNFRKLIKKKVQDFSELVSESFVDTRSKEAYEKLEKWETQNLEAFLVGGVLGMVDERQNYILRRHYIDGVGYAAIGEEIGSTRQSVRKSVIRAIEKIRRNLDGDQV